MSTKPELSQATEGSFRILSNSGIYRLSHLGADQTELVITRKDSINIVERLIGSQSIRIEANYQSHNLYGVKHVLGPIKSLNRIVKVLLLDPKLLF